MLIKPEYEAQQRAVCRLLAKEIRKYYRDEAHRKEFEKWYLETYGEQYEWKSAYPTPSVHKR